jgi:3-carboxy-cis,cis-muconate cycloisomerase
MGDILTRLITLFSGIQLFPERMRRNLDLSGGLIMAEALMLDLGHSIGRQRAHDAVYDAAQATVTEGGTFRDHLAAHPDVSSRLSAERIEALLDPAQYTGMCVPFAERAAVSAREMARAIEQRHNTA